MFLQPSNNKDSLTSLTNLIERGNASINENDLLTLITKDNTSKPRNTMSSQNKGISSAILKESQHKSSAKVPLMETIPQTSITVPINNLGNSSEILLSQGNSNSVGEVD